MSDVTSRVIAPMLEAAQAAQLPLGELFDGLSFGADDLRDGLRLVPWDDYALFASRIGRLLGREGSVEIGRNTVLRSRIGRILGAVAGNLASSAALYNVATWFGRMLYSVTRSSLAENPDGTLVQVVEIPEPHRECEAFFWGCEGAIQATPELLGQRPAEVRSEVTPRRGVFHISPPPALTLSEKLRRWSRTRASVEAICDELEFQQQRFERERARRVQAEAELQRLRELIGRLDK
jgi:hypothetical protein